MFRSQLGGIHTKEVPFQASCLCLLWMQGNPANIPGAEFPSPEQHARNASLLQTASAAGQLRGQRRLSASQDRYLFENHHPHQPDVPSLSLCVCHSRRQSSLNGGGPRRRRVWCASKCARESASLSHRRRGRLTEQLRLPDSSRTPQKFGKHQKSKLLSPWIIAHLRRVPKLRSNQLISRFNMNWIG